MLYSTIAFFLTLIPFLIIRNIGDGFRTPKEIASILGLIAIIGLGFRYKRRILNNYWLFIFLGWCFFCTIFTGHYIPLYLPKNVVVQIPASFFGWKEFFYITLAVLAIHSIALAEFPKQIFRCLSLKITFNQMDAKRLVRCIANTVSLCLIIMCGYAIVQAIGWDDFFIVTSQTGHLARSNIDSDFSLSHRVVGMVGNPSLFSTWIAMCLPLTLYLRNKIGWIALVMSLGIFSITWSMTALIAGFVGIMFYLFFRSKKLFIIILTIVILSGSIMWQFDFTRHRMLTCANPTGRIETHKEAWRITEGRRLIGLGLGTFEYLIGLNPMIVQKLHNENWKELHDEYGQIWFSAGLVGLAIFLMFILTVFIHFLKNITHESITLASCMVAFLVVCTTLFPMRVAPTSFYAVVFTGLLMNVIRR